MLVRIKSECWRNPLKFITIATAWSLGSACHSFAADMPAAPAPPPSYVVPAYGPSNWNGFYVGINGGYGVGSSMFSAPGFSTGGFKSTGAIVGGTIGINYQASNFVVGLEGDAGYATLKGSTAPASGVCNSLTGATASCEANENLLATLRARLGFAIDRVLFYGTAGGAFANVQVGLTPPGAFDTSLQAGWTAGGGIEVLFPDPNWTAKVEYLYVDLSSLACSATTGNCGGTFGVGGGTVSFTENLVRAGFNYKFSF
jgi:outer membrane immunogenic protein